MSELISVIMSTYNEKAEWIRKSVESILNQTYSNIEFVIVLDNPNNEMIQEVLREYEALDTRVRLVYNENNIGLVKSLNKALRVAKGSLIARMDADDISYPCRLETEYKALKDRNADFVMGTVDYLDEYERVDTNTFEKEYYGKNFARIQSIGNVSAHPTWLVKRTVYDKLNGYRAVECCEDYDFVLRALQAGFVCYRISDHILSYRMRRTGVSRSRTLEQFVRMQYIRKMYRKGTKLESLSEKDWNQDFDRITSAENEKFDVSVQLLWAGKIDVSERHYAKGFIKVLRGMFKSRYFNKYFWDNIRWMIAAKFI